MKLVTYASALTLLVACAAQAETPLTVTVKGINAKGVLADEHAYCIPLGKKHAPRANVIGIEPGFNSSPEISWSQGPAGTKSYAIVMTDPAALNDKSDTKPVAKDAPRGTLYHWVLVNIPPETTSIPQGADSSNTYMPYMLQGFYGLRGRNSYSEYNPLDHNDKQPHVGYGGMCVQANDNDVHHYHFTVYALDTDALKLPTLFGGWELMPALKGHVLASGEAVGSWHPSKASGKRK